MFQTTLRPEDLLDWYSTCLCLRLQSIYTLLVSSQNSQVTCWIQGSTVHKLQYIQVSKNCLVCSLLPFADSHLYLPCTINIKVVHIVNSSLFSCYQATVTFVAPFSVTCGLFVEGQQASVTCDASTVADVTSCAVDGEQLELCECSNLLFAVQSCIWSFKSLEYENPVMVELVVRILPLYTV